MTIGNRVLDLLSKKGKKQKDLANYLHTGASTINGWKSENRNPSSDMIIPICEFLGVTCEFLLTGEEKESSIQSILSTEDIEWISLIHRLPEKKQIEFKSKIEGYLECYEEAVAANSTPEKKTGTTNMAK